jgi:hypothetical protein
VAQPQINKSKWGPQQGGLLSDVDPKEISGGNLLVTGVNSGGMNIRNVGKGLNVMPDYEPVYGNDFVYELDDALPQNKKWRIYADVGNVPTPSGADLIVNGDFASSSSWSTLPVPGPSGWSIGAGVATHTPGNSGSIYQFISGSIGEYTVTFDLTVAADYIDVYAGTVLVAGNVNATGPYTFTFDSPVSDFILEFRATNLFNGTLDNVTLVLNDYGYSFNYSITNPTGSVIANGSQLFILDNNISNTLTDIGNFIGSTFTFLSSSWTSTITGSYTGYVEFEFFYAPYFDYIFEITDGLSNYGSIDLVIVQEAIDTGSIGEWNLIGSDDRTSYSFQFWTTRRSLPQELEILNVSDNGSGVIRITTVDPHGLLPNQAVSISLVEGAVEANGIWTVDVIDQFNFDLYNSAYISAYVSGGTVTYNIYGLGEIGVAVRGDDDVVTYTRLLRSIEFNFTTLKQIDVRVKRKQDSRFAAYFTDNYNVPRVFYYKGAFIQDGALNFIDSDNIYEYGNISSELRWLLNNEDFFIEVIGQEDSGGVLKSGNWRYSARLLTSNFTATNWSQLTEGIPVFVDSNTDVHLLGSNPDVPTSKVNRLKLTNNVSGLYTYVEIAALNYINNIAPYGYIIGRFVLSDDDVQYFNHSGQEPEQLDLDPGTLNDFSNAFVLAQNVELLDNRAILSNLTPAQTIDFTEWVKTFKYSLNRRSLETVGVWSTDSLQVGEYQDPMNVYSYKSHMMMETYRYGFRFKLKNGSLTQVFYPGYDIKIDLPATPFPSERLAGTFTSFDLTDQATTPSGGPTEVYSIYISWENINLSFLIDGTPVYNLVDEIIPCRATVVPEVLVHGCGVLGVSGIIGTPLINEISTLPIGTNTNISPYPFISGDATYATSDVYPGTDGLSSFTPRRESIFIFSPDLHFDLTDISFQNGDQLFVFGNPTRHDTFNYLVAGIVQRSYYSEYDGNTSITSNPSPYVFSANPGSFLFDHPNGSGGPTSQGQSVSIGGSVYRQTILSLTPVIYSQNEKSLVCRVSTNITNTSGNTDYGFYRVIYYRPLNNKYGDPSSTVYTEFLPPYRIENNRSIIVSGDFNTYGDVFTQKTYLKFRYPGWWSQSAGDWRGYGAGVGYYTQNRNNIQLRCYISEDFNEAYRITKYVLGGWISFGYSLSGDVGFGNARYLYVAPDGQGRDSQLFYNTGYTPVNNIITERQFNPLLEYQTDWGNAIAWSDSESEGSNTDNLRNFPPLNLKFLDYTQGPITDARAMNGELYTIQNTEIQRQYFNSTAMTSTTGGEVYLGTGAVLSRRGTTMNKFGSRHKWSIIMGLSDKGGEVLYGIDDINNTVWRLGYDGTNSLDEIQGMKAFFANHLDWIRGKYTPAHDEGIRGVANQRYREVIWTLRGRKQFPEWQAEDNIYYSFGFESNLGNELIVNPNFQGDINTNTFLGGWDELTAPLDVWYYGSPGGASNPPFGASRSSFSALTDYLKQINNIPFVAGTTYRIKIVVARYSNNFPLAPNLEIRFQVPTIPFIYSINAPGTYYYNYTAVSGDDNIYIYGPAFESVTITEVSIKEVLNTNGNWIGAPDWVLSNNEACTNPPGIPTGTSLIHDVPNYITPNMPWIVDLTISNYTGGDLRVGIGNITTPPLDIPIFGPGQYQAAASPSVAGVVRFNPDPTFEGCIKGNIKVYTTGVLKEYFIGDIVQTSGYGTIMSTWSQTPDIWICLKNNVTSNPYFPPDPNDPDWELIPHTNPNYYTEYTIVYNELKNKFQTFMSILPRIYAHFQKGYLVPRPISNTGRMYQSDTGIPTSWFAEGIDAQQEDAFIEPIINTPAGRKRFLAARVESDVAPTSMTVTSSTGSSVTGAAEFEQREGNEFDGYVKDTPADSIIQGDYAVFRFTIAATTYNKINSFIASVRERARKWFK